MGLFDKIKNSAVMNGAGTSVQNAGNKSKRIVFERLPSNSEEFKLLPEAALTDPFDTAALTVLAFCFYTETAHYENHGWWFTVKGGGEFDLEINLLI